MKWLGWRLCTTMDPRVFPASTPPDDAGLKPGLVTRWYREKPFWFIESFLELRKDVVGAQA